MRAFIWWLRAAFCKHEWRVLGKIRVDERWFSNWPVHDTHWLHTKECAKCGWILRQRV